MCRWDEDLTNEQKQRTYVGNSVPACCIDQMRNRGEDNKPMGGHAYIGHCWCVAYAHPERAEEAGVQMTESLQQVVARQAKEVEKLQGEIQRQQQEQERLREQMERTAQAIAESVREHKGVKKIQRIHEAARAKIAAEEAEMAAEVEKHEIALARHNERMARKRAVIREERAQLAAEQAAHKQARLHQ